MALLPTICFATDATTATVKRPPTTIMNALTDTRGRAKAAPRLLWAVPSLLCALLMAACGGADTPSAAAGADSGAVQQIDKQATQASAAVVTTAARIPDINGRNAQTWRFARNGDTLSWNGNMPAGTYEMIVTVRGDQYQGAPELRLTVGSQTVTRAIGNTGYADISFGTLTVAAGEHLYVSFNNDRWGGTSDTDRNLYVTNIWPKPVDIAPPQPLAAEKLIKFVGNFVVDNADAQLAIVDRARAKGATTVVYADTKINNWALDSSAGDRWFSEMRRFYDGVKARNMDFVFETISIGYCDSMLASNTNLATGYPVIDQPLRAQSGQLVPVSTASVTNGGFEAFNGNTPNGWGFQDVAGTRTFIDTNTKRSGNAAFRADGVGGQMSRVFTSFSVRPWHQYTLSFWVKTSNLTGRVMAVVQNADNSAQLTSQHFSRPTQDGAREYFTDVSNLTQDWSEIKLSFNSQNNSTVNLGLALFNGSSGSIWWDDVRLDDTPTLNWLVRDDLPRSAKLSDGAALTLGTDLSNPVDSKLGQIGWPGRYGNYHEAPRSAVLSSQKIAEGATVLLSGYHTLLALQAQIGCSWNNAQVQERMRTVHDKLVKTFNPDGILLNYDEIRTGGFEPADRAYATSGDAMAASIKKAYDNLALVAPNVRHYFWSDMVDPVHNARANYYQIANTLDKSWATLDPAKVIIINWWERGNITQNGPASLKHFADLGFKQVIGGYYDEDVADNHRRWVAASQGIANISGSMYTTWRSDFSKVEAFGDLWWK